MTTILAIAVGGAIGSVARYGMTVYADYLFGREFPYGIFLTNILGSVVIGVCFVLIVERALVSELWRSILMVGFLGGFTTFSTFSIQSLELLQAGRLLDAAGYILGSVVLSILGCWIGIMGTRALH